MLIPLNNTTGFVLDIFFLFLKRNVWKVLAIENNIKDTEENIQKTKIKKQVREARELTHIIKARQNNLIGNALWGE